MLAVQILVEGTAMLGEPDYEVKMLMDPGETLNSEGRPRKKVREKFEIDRSTRGVMLFLDSTDRALNAAGWIVRIRAFDADDEPNIQLTYKRRRDIGGDGEGDVENAVEAARGEGFADAPEEYDSQVEWGLDELTLTVSLKGSGGPRDAETLALPGDEDARQLALSNMPSIMQQQVPEARSILEQAHVYGPVHGRRWIGEWKDDEALLEVWNVRAMSGEGEERIAELSFKKKRHESAKKRHKDLGELLDDRDWLASEQLSKTEIILQRY